MSTAPSNAKRASSRSKSEKRVEEMREVEEAEELFLGGLGEGMKESECVSRAASKAESKY